MHRAIAFVGTVTLLTGLASTALAQSKPIGSSADLRGLQERSIQKTAPNYNSSSSSSSAVNNSSTDRQTGVQIDRNVQLIVRPERGNSNVGVYPTDNTDTGNQVQVLYQLDQ